MAENIIYHITVPSGACTFVYCYIAIKGLSNGRPVPVERTCIGCDAFSRSIEAMGGGVSTRGGIEVE